MEKLPDDLLLLPKVELHAHLSGSVSESTLLKIIEKRESLHKTSYPEYKTLLSKQTERSLEWVFKIFKMLHLLTDTLQSVETMTMDVISEFCEDGVAYLELRTTPKNVLGSYSKEEYLKTVIKCIKQCEIKHPIIVRLLVSIDRSRGVEDAWDTLTLTQYLKIQEEFGQYICGIDVSGNPNVGSLLDYIPVMIKAREYGFKLAVHLLEVKTETAFEEAKAVLLNHLVDRIGHGIFLHPNSGGSKELRDIVIKEDIPIELCLTSNIRSGSVQKLEDHHIKLWKAENHPIVICTDDKGVFDTNLSDELHLAMKVLNASPKTILEIARDALKYSFLAPAEIRDVKMNMEKLTIKAK